MAADRGRAASPQFANKLGNFRNNLCHAPCDVTTRVCFSNRKRHPVLHMGAPEKLKMLMIGALARDSNLIGVGYRFGIGIFNFSCPTLQ